MKLAYGESPRGSVGPRPATPQVRGFRRDRGLRVGREWARLEPKWEGTARPFPARIQGRDPRKRSHGRIKDRED